MYSSFPRKDRIAIRIALSTSWGFSTLAGIGGVLLTPLTVVEEIGPFFPILTSTIVLLAGLLATVGVATNRYQWEWVSAWFASAGLFAYLITVWYLTVTGTPTRLQQAAYLTSLLFFYIYRIIACSAHARKQRTIHALTQGGETGPPNA